MEQVQKMLEGLQTELAAVLERLGIAGLAKELAAMQAHMSAADFWQEPLKAQRVSQQEAKLRKRIQPWQQLAAHAQEAQELASLGDESIAAELEAQVTGLQHDFDVLKAELRFAGAHDNDDAIISIYAGAGGTDAQDWAAMLMRMYIRYGEKSGFDVQVIDESAGDEAGIKSVTFSLSGAFAYGKLKGEHGVHRLVRLSPFNADSLRQTSFAKVEVMPKIDDPQELHLDEKDLRIDVYRSGGHGGQSVNTTDSAVRVTHTPTGVTVAIQNERSQLQNKETALTILRSRLAALQMEQHKEEVEELRGPNQSAEWGNQIRSYVLHPYKQVKDLRTRYETSDVDGVLGGDLEQIVDAYLDHSIGS